MKRTGAVMLWAVASVLLWGDRVAGAEVSQGPSPNPSVLTRQDFGDSEQSLGRSLKVRSIDVVVDVVGASATTTMKVRFATPPRGQEADFNLDLPSGSVVTGYALDIQGRMVDGVVVAPRQATKAYEEKVRRGVDPGLAKITRAGDFNTRVFSTRGETERTIAVRFVTPVGPNQPYALPMRLDGAADDISITVRQAGLIHPADIEGPSPGLTPVLTGETEAKAWARQAPVSGVLRIANLAPRPVVTRASNGELFFETLAPAGEAAAPVQPRVRVYWDVSRSRRSDDLNGELALLSSYLERSSAAAVDLITFADAPGDRQTFTGRQMTTALVQTLRRRTYLGATSYSSVFSVAAPRADVCLVFSDGAATVDQSNPRALDCQVFAISSSPEARRNVLTALAAMSGGESIDLRTMDKESAVRRLLAPRVRVLSVLDNQGRPIEVVELGGSDRRIIGRAPQTGPVVIRTASGTTYVPLDHREVIDSDGPAALWAHQKLGEMAVRSGKPAQVLDLARRYQVAGEGAMFVVLESAQDYVENDIAPPSTFPAEQRKEYARLARAKQDADASAKSRRLDQVLVAWNEEKAWWRNPIPRPEKPPKAVGSGAPQSSVPLPSPPPPAARPASPAEVSQDQTKVEQVVVTAERRSSNTRQALSALTGSARRREAPQADAPLGGARADVKIEAAPWNPDRPYLAALKAEPDQFDAVFAEQEAGFGDLPAFYFDVAEYLFRRDKTAQARTVALSAVELPTANVGTYKILADRLIRYGDPDRAIWIYQHILDLEPDRPQPRRDLALALIDRSSLAGVSREQQAADLRQAIGLLNEVVMTPWEPQYNGIELIALMEANGVAPRLAALTGEPSALDPRLRAQMDVDLRVVLDWNTEHTDYDLWVDEPSRERVMYSHNRSNSGGRLSNDMTQGYGPEEYLLKTAPQGRYEVRADGYRGDRFNPNGVTTIRAHLYRNWGRPNQAVETFEVDLSQDEKEPVIGRFKVG